MRRLVVIILASVGAVAAVAGAVVFALTRGEDIEAVEARVADQIEAELRVETEIEAAVEDVTCREADDGYDCRARVLFDGDDQMIDAAVDGDGEVDTGEALAAAQLLEEAAACGAEVSGLLSALKELHSRLGIGLPYSDYRDRVGDARVAYDQINFDALELSCLVDAGSPLEDALNEHVSAQSVWGDCIEDFGCDLDEIDPELQQHWSNARGEISDAESWLDSPDRDSES